MFLMLSKNPRKSNRKKSNRYRAKLKAKNTARQKRVYQAHRSLEERRGQRGSRGRRAPGFSCFSPMPSRQITPNFFPTFWMASSPRSSCSLECVAM